MSDKNLPKPIKSISISTSVEQLCNSPKTTERLSLPQAQALKTIVKSEDESWIDRLYAWADKNYLPDLFWGHNCGGTDMYYGLLRISEHSEQPFRYDPNTYFGLIRTYIPRLSEHF